MHPNPTSGDVHFTFDGLDENEDMSVRLVDLQGRELISIVAKPADVQSAFNAQFENLKGGIYILQINSTVIQQKIRLLKM